MSFHGACHCGFSERKSSMDALRAHTASGLTLWWCGDDIEIEIGGDVVMVMWWWYWDWDWGWYWGWCGDGDVVVVVVVVLDGSLVIVVLSFWKEWSLILCFDSVLIEFFAFIIDFGNKCLNILLLNKADCKNLWHWNRSDIINSTNIHIYNNTLNIKKGVEREGNENKLNFCFLESLWGFGVSSLVPTNEKME